MAAIITVFVFFAVTQPILLLLLGMTVARNHRHPQWRPAEYQPMQILMARQKAERARAAAQAPVLHGAAA